MILVKRLDKVD